MNTKLEKSEKLLIEFKAFLAIEQDQIDVPCILHRT